MNGGEDRASVTLGAHVVADGGIRRLLSILAWADCQEATFLVAGRDYKGAAQTSGGRDGQAGSGGPIPAQKPTTVLAARRGPRSDGLSAADATDPQSTRTRPLLIGSAELGVPVLENLRDFLSAHPDDDGEGPSVLGEAQGSPLCVAEKRGE